MFSLGTAACVGYGLAINEDNKRVAKDRLKAAGLVPVVFPNGNKEDVTFASIEVIAMKPWKFITFPASPVLGAKRTIDAIESSNTYWQESEKASSSSDEQDMTVVPTRRSVMYTLKLILRKQPLGDITYPVFATETMIYDIIKPYIPTDVITMDQINDWVGKEKCFGTKTRQMIDGKRQRGRPLHVVKEEFRDFTVESASNFRSFRKMVKDTQDDWLTIGYVRKSVEVNLKDEARRCLLELMAAKMRSKMLCQQVFASWCSGAHSSILDRDHKDSPSMLYVDGDTQDLVAMATKSSKNVRLAVIDFAGFSTNPDDVYEFLKMAKKVKEVVIDHGDHPEVLTRHELLRVEGIIDKFACRPPCVRRSTI